MVLVKDRPKAVPVDKFGEHVQRMHADRDKWFEQEYNVRELNVDIYHTSYYELCVLHNVHDCEIEDVCRWVKVDVCGCPI